MAKRNDDPPHDDTPDISPLVESVLGLLEEKGVPSRINDSIVRILEWYESGEVQVDYTTNPGAGFLLIGVDPERCEVVMNLDEDRTGHINFSPKQAITLASKLVTKAKEALNLSAMR